MVTGRELSIWVLFQLILVSFKISSASTDGEAPESAMSNSSDSGG